MYRFFLAILLAALFMPAAAQSSDARTAGAKLTAHFYAEELDVVWASMDERMRGALKSPEGLATFRTQIAAQLGTEQTVLKESVSQEGDASVYRRRAKFEKYPGVILVLWAFSPDGKVAGFLITPDQTAPQPPAPSTHLDYRTKSALRLPFREEFLVFWGGRTVAQNYHAIDANQRFAYDLVIVRNGVTHAGDGRRNADYFCFGTPILAPARGEVVEVVSDVEDNVPGQMISAHVTGNRVIIDHGNGEFSLLAHFRHGSLKVKQGDRVAAGEQLGECGNSGNSSEPHIHYQLQAGPEFSTSAGLPAQFEQYVADGLPVERGEPVKGQRIRPSP